MAEIDPFVAAGIRQSQRRSRKLAANKNKPHQVYRHFDSSGVLLYVGISMKTLQRTGNHKNSAHWFRKISRIEIQHVKNLHEALAIEAQAILEEKPLHNIQCPGAPNSQPSVTYNDNSPESPCMRCEGSGKQHAECRYCGEDGMTFDDIRPEIEIVCPVCFGLSALLCVRCEGTGTEDQELVS